MILVISSVADWISWSAMLFVNFPDFSWGSARMSSTLNRIILVDDIETWRLSLKASEIALISYLVSRFNSTPLRISVSFLRLSSCFVLFEMIAFKGLRISWLTVEFIMAKYCLSTRRYWLWTLREIS